MLHGLSCGTSEICEFFASFNTAAAHAYVSPRPSWFILGAISALGHVVFSGFISKNEKKTKTNKQTNKQINK